MSEEEREGHAKITIDIEINDSLMDLIQESMTKMPKMMKAFEKKQEKE